MLMFFFLLFFAANAVKTKDTGDTGNDDTGDNDDDTGDNNDTNGDDDTGDNNNTDNDDTDNDDTSNNDPGYNDNTCDNDTSDNNSENDDTGNNDPGDKHDTGGNDSGNNDTGDNNNTDNNDTGGTKTTDIRVSFDGSWSQRGFTAAYGYGSVVSIETGKVLDYYVACKYCHECTAWEKKDPTHESDEWKKWKRAHDQICALNHSGSSKAMEPDIATTLWCRSEERHSLRYMVFVGDGDCASYGHIKKLKPYGNSPEDEVKKEDCLGHIQKRMGSQLRALKRNWQGRKLPDNAGLGGRNRLTISRITNFQNFYGKAIRDNLGNVDAASDAVMATFYHSVSTNESPQHHLCPETSDTWCGYQKSRQNGSPYEHQPALPEEVAKVVKPVFETLAKKSLLSRCMEGLTQNSNESLHAIIWGIAPKHIFNGAEVTLLAGAMATGLFNDGQKFLLRTLTRMGYPPGVYTKEAADLADAERLRKAREAADEEKKEKRKSLKKKKHAKEDKAAQKEDVLYEAGGFGPDGELLQVPEAQQTAPAKKKQQRRCRKCNLPMKGHQKGRCADQEATST